MRGYPVQGCQGPAPKTASRARERRIMARRNPSGKACVARGAEDGPAVYCRAPLARDETSPQVIDYPLFRSGGNAILAAQEWRLARIHYRISLEDWSGRFGMSSRRFSRAFFGYAGTTPHQWLTEQRMLLASEHLVGSNASIDEIAAAVGIRSVSAFSSAFTARWGIAPTRYRQLHKDAGGSAVHSLAVET